VNVNATIDDCDSDMGSGALYHDNRVRVDKVEMETNRKSGRDVSLPVNA